VFAFGNNFNGQLGLGADVTQSILPAGIINLESHVISDVSCGESHTAFVTGRRPFSDYINLFCGFVSISELQVMGITVIHK